MNRSDIFQLITQHATDVIPSLADHSFKLDDSLRDLGANSIDRSEIIMMTMESLSLRMPMIDFAKAENIDDLTGIFHGKF